MRGHLVSIGGGVAIGAVAIWIVLQGNEYDLAVFTFLCFSGALVGIARMVRVGWLASALAMLGFDVVAVLIHPALDEGLARVLARALPLWVPAVWILARLRSSGKGGAAPGSRKRPWIDK